MRRAVFIFGLMGLYGPALHAQASCTSKQITFNANDGAAVPAEGSAMIWGGSATQGEEKGLAGMNFFSPEWLAGQRLAMKRKLETFLYLEGKCGKTDGEDDGEEDKCRTKEASWAAVAKSKPDSGPLWQQYTLAQMAAAKAYNVTYCEADNVEDKGLLVPFMKAFEKAYNEGRIGCKLVLKNVRKDKLVSLKNEFKNTNFIAPFAIFENDVGSQAGLDTALQALLKNPKAVTIISSNSKKYGTAFTKRQIASCGSGAPGTTVGTAPIIPIKGAPFTDPAIAFGERL